MTGMTHADDLRATGQQGMIYSLRPSGPDDKALVKHINDRCYRAVVIAQFGSWDDALQTTFFENKWNPEKYDLIELAGDVIGVLSVVKAEDHWFLSEIQILPEHQGQGLGTQIIRDILDAAEVQSVPVTLQVLKKSDAIALYERLGFGHTSATDTHRLMMHAPQKRVPDASRTTDS